MFESVLHFVFEDALHLAGHLCYAKARNQADVSQDEGHPR